ncbi:RagB/SusD family nutrient uptake outer membrane protein [Flavobacterium restrictum]|uniref:RagB/SusD family nutrient uptake outer membrane protein n=1 Tax=Flavobacterium restrictum TaxID=2594428 RepID=A0A553E2Z5_9FLAO|nr:RagB/SusD family nutrient uptake outer membrane protein [Flavobacterium restrictum]TRX39409.1 RagB/SusD family nutrient uptake outer membrane protein [Flavobacterium restrictum]
MKNFKINKIGLGIMLVLFLTISCTGDLDTEPKGQDKSLAQLLVEQPGLAGLISKVYGSFALSGASGPASTDTPGDDAGESPFLRGIINLQDFSADDMKNRWGDNGLDQLTTTANWDENNKFMRYMYNRVYYTVPQANQVIAQMNTYNISGKDQVISEMRFLRALAYYYLIDCFGKGVLLTEADLGSTVLKKESTRQELFDFVEKELLDIEDKLPVTNGYGQANKACGRMLLAKLYLNAKVYTGTARYADALKYSKKVIDEGGYSLAPNFQSLFCADNDKTAAKNEIIYALIADPLISQSYGNTTYLVLGSLNSASMQLSDYGATDGWGGHRATKAWYGLFGNSADQLDASSDDRAHLFWSNANDVDPAKRHSFEMTNYKTWTDGYPSTKFRNSNFAGTSSPTYFSGTDFPLFRLADVYLMYAESVLRGGGGTTAEALQYVNAIRIRSHAATITLGQLTLDYILDERARELNFEGHRRTDLIRFEKFTGGSYLWPWKGGVKNGTAIPESYNLFPIPLKAIQSNPNLTQNTGY